jgi:hypothetical protein
MPARTARPVIDRVAEMLRAGRTYAAINAETGVSKETIRRVRKDCGLPVPGRGRGWDAARAATTVREKWELHLVDRPGGHQHWRGVYSHDVPLLCLADTNVSARRLSFEFHHGRPAEGQVSVDCDDPHCVAGAHMVDRPLRKKLRDLYAAVTGDNG